MSTRRKMTFWDARSPGLVDKSIINYHKQILHSDKNLAAEKLKATKDEHYPCFAERLLRHKIFNATCRRSHKLKQEGPTSLAAVSQDKPAPCATLIPFTCLICWSAFCSLLYLTLLPATFLICHVSHTEATYSRLAIPELEAGKQSSSSRFQPHPQPTQPGIRINLLWVWKSKNYTEVKAGE